MASTNEEKMITKEVFEQSLKDILQAIADNCYDWEEYTDSEISDILDISDEQAIELTKIINDNVKATNKLWSSSKTDEEIKAGVVEANKYTDSLIAGLASIKLEYVTALPDVGEGNVIYILSGTPNTLNVYNMNTSSFVTVGNLEIDLSKYYTKEEIDELLQNLANSDDVVHMSNVVDDLSNPTNDTIIHTLGLKTILDTFSGIAGKSAYEIAVDNGFTGTEAEWLESIKGVKGNDGISVSSIDNDENNVITATYSDGRTETVGNITINIAADFLTDGGFGQLRYYNGKFQYYDKDTDTWLDTSVSPDNVYIMNMMPQEMKSIAGVYDIELGKNKLKFEEPDDTVIDGQIACMVEKVIIRRKLGSAPIDQNDGILVGEVKRSEFGKYKKNWYIDETFNPTNGEDWYYKIFPKSTTGFCNDLSTNEINIFCKDYYLYGFKIDQNESDPASMITYIEDNAAFNSAYMNYGTDTFDYGDWGGTWFIKDLKPCMLKYDGTVDYELDKNDYTKKLDGTDSDVANVDYEGNAMMGVPKVYIKIVDNGDDTANIYISNKKVDDDFYCWSHLDNNGNEIDYCYMPIYNGYSDGTRLRSLSGKAPMGGKTAAQEITLATANNTDSNIIWYTEVYSDRQLINILLMLIGKSTDSQTVFGIGYTETINNTGILNNKGLFWGSKNNSCVKVFGMENWWGNQWRRIAGWVCDNGTQKVKLTYGQSDGSTIDGYNINGSGYIACNKMPKTFSTYISKMDFNKYGLLPVKMSGSATTYYTDGIWVATDTICYARVASGGPSFNGMFCVAMNSISTYAHSTCSASISCKPLATTA